MPLALLSRAFGSTVPPPVLDRAAIAELRKGP